MRFVNVICIKANWSCKVFSHIWFFWYFDWKYTRYEYTCTNMQLFFFYSDIHNTYTSTTWYNIYRFFYDINSTYTYIFLPGSSGGSLVTFCGVCFILYIHIYNQLVSLFPYRCPFYILKKGAWDIVHKSVLLSEDMYPFDSCFCPLRGPFFHTFDMYTTKNI